jgi:hypothetical protein
MTTIDLTNGRISIEMEGADKLWSLRSRLLIPTDHVLEAQRAEADARRWLHGLRLGGTHLPGVISAGTFRSHGKWTFWDVRDPEKAIALELRDERYDRLVVDVEDPDEIVQRIREAAGGDGAAGPEPVRRSRAIGGPTARVLAAAAVAVLEALILGIVMPRGPLTRDQALTTMAAGLLVGGAAGFVLRSRWAMLIAPLAFAAVFELVRLGETGPTVDGIHLGSTYGLLAFVTGRLVHGLILFAPMLVGVSAGVAAARRWGPAAGDVSPPRHPSGCIYAVAASRSPRSPCSRSPC